MRRIVLAAALCSSAAVLAQDHPLVTAYPGSSLKEREVKQFGEFDLPTGPWKGATPSSQLHLEGKLTRLSYLFPVDRSTLEVARNYESALKQAGFQILFSCKQLECGNGSIERWGLRGMQAHPTKEVRYLAAKLARPEGDAYVAVHVEQTGKGSWDHPYYIVVIETKPMQQGMVTVNAAALAGDISNTGHAALYGIYFDTGKADLKPESQPALAEVVKLLQANNALKIHVVGHTDNVGSAQPNMDLSRRRAGAVVAELEQRGIAAARLHPEGLGPYAPIATNRTDEGRGKNRRVELVEQ
jgi:outer membrane protein OmpA-like peptidoglycan-associated protein